jgi:hypothetical protein
MRGAAAGAALSDGSERRACHASRGAGFTATEAAARLYHSADVKLASLRRFGAAECAFFFGFPAMASFGRTGFVIFLGIARSPRRLVARGCNQAARPPSRAIGEGALEPVRAAHRSAGAAPAGGASANHLLARPIARECDGTEGGVMRSRVLLGLGLLAGAVAGCATITRGTNQVVAVNTPGVPGATCTLTSSAIGTQT